MNKKNNHLHFGNYGLCLAVNIEDTERDHKFKWKGIKLDEERGFIPTGCTQMQSYKKHFIRTDSILYEISSSSSSMWNA